MSTASPFYRILVKYVLIFLCVLGLGYALNPDPYLDAGFRAGYALGYTFVIVLINELGDMLARFVLNTFNIGD